ncbi:alpha/beta hydrolase [Pseudomonas fakonensis]|uniref:Alpha/beta hydrolase n=1 Tax=Pseudomonas fakonensis TaxID=2842355 RepID=A0ABX8NEC2_9PSED|nr:alpha/beta fold hydrolase [Pseudomonas fakonensis]QXH53838.1 alpha/beta hydrolase [Pseudomonas fakonensis]
MSSTEREEVLIDGPVGRIQLLVDHPEGQTKGIVLVSHPQPLLGGSPRHVVPLTLARQLCANGWRVVRPSFRGVGLTDGEHDAGLGETEDSLAVIEYLGRQYPQFPVSIVGFSFGAYVFARVACALSGQLQAVALLGLPVGDVPGGRHYPGLPVPTDCLLAHGELDEMAPLANLLQWAAPEHRSVSVHAGVNHFFKGCLNSVADQVITHLEQKRLSNL